MKDSRIGAFGALALLGVVLTKLRALDVLQSDSRSSALFLSPMYGRWACVMMAGLAVPMFSQGRFIVMPQTDTRATGVSGDGTVVVGGISTGGSGWRWTESEGFQSIGGGGPGRMPGPPYLTVPSCRSVLPRLQWNQNRSSRH